jgi:inosine-uridine nucleoside N-ribohydrolase
MTSSRPKMLIDCDPGHDDAVAILFAARHCEVVGITTVHGNNSLENTTRNALAVLELAALDLPLAVGASDPLAQLRQASAPVHGSGGLDGAELPAPRKRPLEVHAVDFLVEMASKHRGELVLAVLGPATNVALALRREPRLKHWLREITMMGGSTDRGNITPAAEFNVHCDPEAAWAVFSSGIPVRMVGLNVTRRTGFDATDIAAMRASGRKVAGVAAELMEFYLARQRERRGAMVAPMHDVCAIVPYADGSLVTYTDARVEVELAGRYTRGMTVCDLRPAAMPARDNWSAQANARVAIDADSRLLIDLVVQTLLAYP